MTVPTTPPPGLTARALYGMLRRLTGAEIVGLRDTAGNFTGDTVEEALAELAEGVGITDVSAAAATELTIAAGVVTTTQTYHTIDTEADAASDDLDTISGLADGQFYVFSIANAGRNVVFKHGTGNLLNPSGRDITLDVTNDKVFGFSNGTSFFALGTLLATPSAGGLASALASVAVSQGASLVGVQDAGGLLAAANVETALAELATTTNRIVAATVACANATGGATTALLTVQLKDPAGVNITAARQVALVSTASQYDPIPGAPNASLTLGTVTAGSIIATPTTGSAWLIETDATGLFACTATNTDDEVVYFSAQTSSGGVSSGSKACMVFSSNSDSAAWSA